jgi:hypothetical protein
MVQLVSGGGLWLFMAAVVCPIYEATFLAPFLKAGNKNPSPQAFSHRVNTSMYPPTFHRIKYTSWNPNASSISIHSPIFRSKIFHMAYSAPNPTLLHDLVSQ